VAFECACGLAGGEVPDPQGEVVGAGVPVKVLCHTAKTIHPRAAIAPEHSDQLLGHESATLGERVYLHHHGPSLVIAAAYETFMRRLLGDPPSEADDLPEAASGKRRSQLLWQARDADPVHSHGNAATPG